jgi:hypothetical protein
MSASDDDGVEMSRHDDEAAFEALLRHPTPGAGDFGYVDAGLGALVEDMRAQLSVAPAPSTELHRLLTEGLPPHPARLTAAKGDLPATAASKVQGPADQQASRLPTRRRNVMRELITSIVTKVAGLGALAKVTLAASVVAASGGAATVAAVSVNSPERPNPIVAPVPSPSASPTTDPTPTASATTPASTQPLGASTSGSPTPERIAASPEPGEHRSGEQGELGEQGEQQSDTPAPGEHQTETPESGDHSTDSAEPSQHETESAQPQQSGHPSSDDSGPHAGSGSGSPNGTDGSGHDSHSDGSGSGSDSASRGGEG